MKYMLLNLQIINLLKLHCSNHYNLAFQPLSLHKTEALNRLLPNNKRYYHEYLSWYNLYKMQDMYSKMLDNQDL